MQFVKRFFSTSLVSILLVSGILFYTNYDTGTYLTGWDNLQTDLNPALGIKRAWFSVWQEYQSFGLVAGMAHAADLVRAVFIWLLSFILPQNLLRYTFLFTMVAIGGIGMYRLLQLTGFRNKQNSIALIGALFYMLNYATTQILFVPFEAFTIFFAALPWCMWIFLLYLETPSYKHFLLLALINILATPFALSQQLFVVYGLVLGLIWVGKFFRQQSWHIIKGGLVACIVIGIINSFWIVPQIYFLATSGDVVMSAKMNQLTTEDIFFLNLENGTLKNYITLENFFTGQVGRDGRLLFEPWIAHRNTTMGLSLVYLFAFIPFIGIWYKSKYRLPFILLYIMTAIALLSNTFPFDFINILLRKNAFINQIFRSPFTKFVIPYSIVVTYFVACGIALLYQLVGHLKRFIHHPTSIEWIRNGIQVVLILLLFAYAFPSFNGKYISSDMKVVIPDEYSDMIEYFKHVDTNKRIALLPDYTFWGWFNHQWGYNGSGFLWYGIEQPIVSRTFDVWSKPSESYYWEINQAIESVNVDQFETVLEKYHIDYLIYDTSLLPISTTYKGMQYSQIDQLLVLSDKFTIEQEGTYTKIIKVNHDNSQPVDDFISVERNLPNIGPHADYTNDDTAYARFGTYKTDHEAEYDVYYPFIDLFSETQLQNKQWLLEEDDEQFILSAPIGDMNEADHLLQSDNSLQQAMLLQDGTTPTAYVPIVETFIYEDMLYITIQKTKVTDFVPTQALTTSCGPYSGVSRFIPIGETLKITSMRKATDCISFEDRYIDQRYGYILRVKNENEFGRRLYFYIVDGTKKQTVFENRLQRDTELYLIHPNNPYGLGYTFTFQNQSYWDIPTENSIHDLDMYLFPYDYVKNIRITQEDARIPEGVFSTGFKADKHNYHSYTVELTEQPHDTDDLILYQSYHPGWQAYSTNSSLESRFPVLFGTPLEHFRINNWANGWQLPSTNYQLPTTITIIFWPQYLQYLGYILIVIIIPLLFLLHRKSTTHHSRPPTNNP